LDKKDLLVQLIQHLQQEIDVTMNAVNEAHALASHEQSKPENQYDTLALEAAYLAHGQSERIAELQRQVMLLNHFDFLEYNDDSRIAVGALVCVEEFDIEVNNPDLQWFWLLPVAGGVLLNVGEIEIRTITAKAPLADKLLGSYVGDEVVLNLSLNSGHKKKQFEVIELL
jgi:transcription elongation GreA/GreB family factor